MGNNCYRNHKKNCIILESNWECAHGLIDITVVNNKNVLVNNI
jgi:Holliday junction resolvase-like predicted endonuclease